MQESANTAQKAKTAARHGHLKEFISRYEIIFVLLGMIVLVSFLTPSFLKVQNMINVFRQISIIGIISVGMTIIMISGGIDLSPGSIIALTSVIVASMAHPGQPFLLSILLVCVIGILCGLLNGVIIAKFSVPPFIATLGMLTAARGAALLYSDGRPIGDLSSGFEFIGSGKIAGIPVPIIIFVVIAVLGHIILNNTKFGKNVYAIGGNEKAAIVCGINVDRNKVMIYAFGGLMAAIAGVILTARISAGHPASGVGYELDAIASAVIGGTSLSGGIGYIGGTVIGALVIGVLNNSLDLLGVSPYWQQIIKGVIIVAAVIIDMSRKKIKK